MEELFKFCHGTSVVRTFWQITAVTLFTTAVSSSGFAGDAQSRLPASQAAKKNVQVTPPLEVMGPCRATNVNFSKKGNEYSGTVKIELTTERSGKYSVMATLYGNMGLYQCSIDKPVYENFHAGNNEVNVSFLCKPKIQAGTTWNTFSINLYSPQRGYRCYPKNMTIVQPIQMPLDKQPYKKLR